ncbi:MAG: DUF3575 domain-containing protein [Gammaproteobacteria bacterium]|nr:DUF3575 domain-containing protein [Gammaproteobacteria bacterium]MDH5802224.1 DUF3575 domain-containing protein [Gammaproteobacteria bacterium]
MANYPLLTPATVSAQSGDWNVRTSPLSDLFGIYNVELDYAVNQNWALGPMYNRFDFEYSDTTIDSSMWGVRVNYYLKNALEGGWVGSLSAGYGTVDITRPGTVSGVPVEFSTSTSVRVYTALFSYQAMWDSFNMMFGLGASYFSMPETVVGTYGVDALTIDTGFISGIVPNAEFSMGWRF